MRKILIFFLVVLAITILFFRFFYKPLLNYFGVRERAGVKIESNQKAKVLIDGSSVGNTPYQDENLKEGEILVKVISDNGEKEASPSSAKNFSWEGKVKLTAGTLTVVNRELGDSWQTSSGEVITLEKGEGATIVTTPNSASITIDGADVGKSPLSIPKLAPGEHQFILSRENYLKRSIRATVVAGYNLTLIVDLSVAENELTNPLPVATPVPTTQTAVVNNTPNGFLRVREKASTSSLEVGRLNNGETVNITEEVSGGWIKVLLKTGKEGYISSTYLKKTNP
jgi:hypothetical protein